MTRAVDASRPALWAEQAGPRLTGTGIMPAGSAGLHLAPQLVQQCARGMLWRSRVRLLPGAPHTDQSVQRTSHVTDTPPHASRRHPGWALAWRLTYAFLRLIDPLLRISWRVGALGITSRLDVLGRRSGRPRSILVGLLRVDEGWYVGHPNGPAAWTRNLEAAGEAVIRPWTGTPIRVSATRLGPGPERDAAIRATASQQPFPGDLLYRASRSHVLAVGVYFRLEPT